MGSDKEDKAIYSGLFITDEHFEELWEPITGVPQLPKVVAHHTTLKFGLKKEEADSFEIGVKVDLPIIGWASSETHQVFVVGKVAEFESVNKWPHITMALGLDAAAKDSNTMLEKLDGRFPRFLRPFHIPVISGIQYQRKGLLTVK